MPKVLTRAPYHGLTKSICRNFENLIFVHNGCHFTTFFVENGQKINTKWPKTRIFFKISKIPAYTLYSTWMRCYLPNLALPSISIWSKLLKGDISNLKFLTFFIYRDFPIFPKTSSTLTACHFTIQKDNWVL